MKKSFYIILMILIFFLITGFITYLIININSTNKINDIKKENVSKISNDPKSKIIFVIIGKNIDFNKMEIDDIVDQIQKDSILEIKKLSPEIYIKPQIIKVYLVEDITCNYLKKRFDKNMAGEIVYEYNGKLLIKLNDGVIKVYHGHGK